MPKAKNIEFGHAGRMKVKAGVDKAADAVRPTLGAIGMTALIEYPGLDPLEVDDGVSILKSLTFKDKHENMGLDILRKAAVRTSAEGGDGTATTTVETQALAHEAFKEVADDSSKIRDVKERLSAGLQETLSVLSTMKRDVNEEDVERIAAISSLDSEVAKHIAATIKEVGVDGVITVERGAKLGYSTEVVKGARFNKGLISPFFINDHAHAQTVLEDPFIVLVDRKVSTNEQIIPLLQSIGTGKHILVIAVDVDSVALGTLAANAMKGIASIACVQNPLSASPARDFLFDMAALTGATVISEEMGMKLEEATVALCGRAEKVVVTRDTTTIIGGKSKKVTVMNAVAVGDTSENEAPMSIEQDTLTARIAEINGKIENTTSDYERGMLEDRLAALTGGIGVIRVGAYTDTEFNAKKLKFDNAVNATQAALQEGVLPGGGIALLNASYQVKEPMFKVALCAAFNQMAINAGMHPEVALTKLDGCTAQQGINFLTRDVVNMFDAGIIDPYKVIRLALESATAITRSLIGFETAITIAEDDKLEANA